MQLGWDPKDEFARRRLRSRLSAVRARLDHGEAPEEVMCGRARQVNPNVHWEAWCRNAFLALPDYQGTSEDVCAVLQANPYIALLLDQRISANTWTVPRWRDSVFFAIRRAPGVAKTGAKRNGLLIYRYDPQAAALADAAKAARWLAKRKGGGGGGGGGKGEASMPHLGNGQ
ncbi:hypothetical protein HYH02_014255 [Chlamydomonas schloesseri]|uniref:Uncharacterized protein n=1 Tax=Chlamydomonas schloesseri TaxID=2026947 RepID=A0A835SKN2_9CHLO|nr:hypothetical protein HYH02_014255 [Chlamydomonas schloesseri]|eukprot:KAG2428843.1 hypothetical protein HYH02_014255 [Chlamydomonas schloesseri]